jgi:hypothetical protein
MPTLPLPLPLPHPTQTAKACEDRRPVMRAAQTIDFTLDMEKLLVRGQNNHHAVIDATLASFLGRTLSHKLSVLTGLPGQIARMD